MKGRERPGLMTCSVLARKSVTGSVLVQESSLGDTGYVNLEAYCREGSPLPRHLLEIHSPLRAAVLDYRT